MKDQEFKNKVVLITGAAGGLGSLFAERFIERGARVVLGDIDQDAVNAVASRLNKLSEQTSGQAWPCQLDVTNENSVDKVVESTIEKWQRIDILVNNAAIYDGIIRKPFYELKESEWDSVMDVNLKGSWMMSKAVYSSMKNNGGRIINISSATFMSGSPHWAHYVASKGGLVGLTRSMAREIGDQQITVNAVAPGFTLTEASKSLMSDAESYGVDRGAIKRACQPEDIAGAVLFFASEDAAFITGQTLIVDGGRQFI